MNGLAAPRQQVIDSIRPIYVIQDIQAELNGLEKYYPELMGNSEYVSLREKLNILDAANLIIGFEEVERVYERIVTFMKTAQIRDNVIEFGKPRAKNKPLLSEFLPATFADFVDRISQQKQEADYLEDGLEAAAHSLILGEIPHGLTAVIPRFREAVKNRTMDELTDLGAAKELASLKEGDLHELLQIVDEDLIESHLDDDGFAVGLSKLSRRVDHGEIDFSQGLSLMEEEDGEVREIGKDSPEVALAILSVRKEIHGQYRSKKNNQIPHDTAREKRPKEKRAAEFEELRRREPALYGLVRAIGLHEKIESPHDLRRRLASRVTRIMYVQEQQ
jgi:hypothetical protein